MASAASDALYWVVRPNSMARDSSCSNSAPVAPDTARTRFIPASKSPAVFNTAAPMPTMGVVTRNAFQPLV